MRASPGCPSGATPSLTAEAIAEVGPARYVHDATSPRMPVAADAARDFLRARRVRGGDRARWAPKYFATDVGRLRLIALDTVNPHGGWQGSLDETQFAWLRDQLDEAADRYVVIASHHPSPTLTNDYAPEGAERAGARSRSWSTLLEHPNVIAWIAGHVHFHFADAARRRRRRLLGDHDVVAHRLAAAGAHPRVRAGEDEGRPEIAIISTVVDHGAPAAVVGGRPRRSRGIASVSRALSANDYRLRESSLRGLNLDSAPDVRNVVWRVPDPLR